MTTTTTVPKPGNELADELLRVLLDADPLRAVLLGLPAPAGLPDPTERAERALAERLRGVVARADGIDRAALDPADRLTLDVLRAIAVGEAGVADARKPEWQVTDLWDSPVAGMLIFLPMSTLPGPGEADGYVGRLRALDGYLAGVADRHRAGVVAGRVPVERLVRASVAQVDGYLAAPERDPFTRPEPPAAWDRAARFRAEVERALVEVVRPAFRRYRDVLEAEIAPHARPDDRPGLSWLPGGDEAYQVLVRTSTTTTRTPEELHETGLGLVARLAEEYAQLGGRVFGVSDPAEVMRRLREDPALRCTSAEQMLEEARRAIERAEEAAPRWFGRLPAQRCAVRVVPEEDAPRAPGAYYMPAALDGTRPGTYFQNTRDPAGLGRHVLQPTAFHEAVPGHHFQVALAQEMDVPMLRRIFEFDAFDEGWALYCERLADEMGLYTDDVARLGMLAGDSMRAVRLVVDTGLHALGWSRGRALDYMVANTPLARTDLEVEVDRYIAAPAQALSYMVGRLEIQRLRAEAERRLGAAFDVRAFHDTVLGAGSVPMVTLAARVDDWLAAPSDPGDRAG